MAEKFISSSAPEFLVGEYLRRRGWKLVAAESCTGGLVGHLLTNVPGSSDYFLGSLVSYANEAKEGWLGVNRETLERHGAVSREVVLEMARGARRSLSAAFSEGELVAISVSGVAGPGGGTPEKPVGLVWIGLSAPGYENAWRFYWQGMREENKQQSARQALVLLLDFLRERGDTMTIEPVQVKARWDGGGFSPRSFIWRGQVFPVESTGRQWEDDEGVHVLCMVAGGAVFELIFRLRPAGWWVNPPAAPAAA